MRDARVRALRDRQWELDAARREGFERGWQEGFQEGMERAHTQVQIQLIQLLEEISGAPVTDEATLRQLSLQQLQLMTSQLRSRLLNVGVRGRESAAAEPQN
ncbi:MAG: hypothetical protein RLZZ232_513 [Planctomycetota bacterium]|jgi:hypothetical protein